MRDNLFSMAMTWTTNDLMSVLYMLVAVLLLLVLYQVLFIVVDLRKITRRIESLSKEIESVVKKPLSLIDEVFGWVLVHLTPRKKKDKQHKASEHEKKVHGA